MDTDQVKGRIDEVKGKAGKAAGKATGDKDLGQKGTIQKTKGKVQAGYGDLEEKIRKALREARTTCSSEPAFSQTWRQAAAQVRPQRSARRVSWSPLPAFPLRFPR